MLTKVRLLVALLLLLGIFSSNVYAAGAGTGPVPAVHAPEQAWTAPHVADQLLVKLPPGSPARRLPGGLTVLHEIPELGLALVQAPSGKNLAEAAAQLTEQAAVEWAEPNYTLSLDFTPNDPKYPSYQLAYLNRIAAASAWDLSTGRPEIIIAVLDTGVDMTHEDLAAAIWTNGPESDGQTGVDDDGNGFVDDIHGWDFASGDNDPSDDHGHGTHVSGIAAARIDNGIGIAGMAGRATIMPVDVFQGGIGTYEALIRAIIYATDNGARVINMSLGASSYSKGEEAAVDYAYNHGVVLVAAAGNTGREEYHYPAAHVHAIAVASTTADDIISSFSTRGDWVDVAAPGSTIYSTFPHNGYGYLSGTSMATPHVSGLAALILSRNPTLTPEQVRAIIESTADDLGPSGRDIYFGAGRINASGALAGTPAGGEPPPAHTPGPGLDVDLPGCTELVTNGGFEDGTAGWGVQGPVEVVTSEAATGTHSLYFGPSGALTGLAAQDTGLPHAATAALIRFDYRIDPKDYGRGSSPSLPFDDWFKAELLDSSGTLVSELLRTGNTADTVQSGLNWDHYIYRLDSAELASLAAAGPLQLRFTSFNDSDGYPTEFWLDDVSFCVKTSGSSYRYLEPFVAN